MRSPEEIAKATVAKLTSPVGAPDKAELAVRLLLPRPPWSGHGPRNPGRRERAGLIETLIVTAAADE